MAEMHENMSFEDYCAIDAINASALKQAVTPDHLRAYLAGEMKREDTDDMRFGRAMHCMILEEESFAERFSVLGWCSEKLKTGKNAGKQCKSQASFICDGKPFCGTHKGENATSPVDYVTDDERDRLNRIAEKLKTSPANEYLARGGYCEAVIVWEWCGFKLKTRIDRLSVTPDLVTIIDLKKCQVGRAGDAYCRKECEDRGYHIAAMMNVAACMAMEAKWIEQGKLTTKPAYEFYLLFQEDKPPYGANLIQADDDDLRIAKRVIEGRLNDFRDCQKTGVYHSYQRASYNVHVGLLSAWAKKGEDRVN